MDEPDSDGEFHEEDEFYDDEDEPQDEGEKIKARIKAKNKADNLLYDAKEDEKNSAWVEKHMKKGRKSDAMLMCPCCFTPLCYDCQRHDTYKNQFRAMFVVNCQVDTTQTLKFGKGEKIRRVKRETVDPNTEELYNPVMCTGCDTEIAVMDKDEVYHFFNIIAADA